jgi:molybdate transport system substrate-binding protein
MKAFIVGAVLGVLPITAHAQTITIKVAAAANLTGPLANLINDFQALHSTFRVNATYDSSGFLESQINGTCPGCSPSSPNVPGYDLFLAADTEHPLDLINHHSSLVAPYNPATPSKFLINYVVGGLELYSNTPGVNVMSGLPSGWTSVAIATPSAAPYGLAAQQVLKNVYGVATLPDTRVHEYSNITTTYDAVNGVLSNPPTELYGFVARSQICTHGDTVPVFSGQSHQSIAANPGVTYDQIDQGGVVVARSARTPAQSVVLTQFIQYLTGKNFSGGAVTPNGTGRLVFYCYSLPANPYP